MKRRFSLLVIFLFLIGAINAQENEFKGTITAFTLFPIEGAEIKIKSSGIKIMSDSLGNFIAKCQEKDKLQIKAPGFKNRKIKVTSKNLSMVIDLEPGGKRGSEVADAEESNPRDSVYRKDHIDTEKMGEQGYPNVLEMIRSRVAGVHVVGNHVEMRGEKHFGGSNAALVVVNGVMTTNDMLKTIPATDVKSIDVLKGASAARYGSRGMNGVVEITLKDENPEN